MNHQKKKLITIASDLQNKKNLTPEEILYLQEFKKNDEESPVLKLLNNAAFPVSIVIGMLFIMFPDFFDTVVNKMPSWTNLSPSILAGVEYLWDFIGEPIGKANIMYHMPNIVLYSFGIAGIKTLIDSIEHRSWLEKVLQAQELLQENIKKGYLFLQMKKGHSLLFVGNGDFIGMQFSLNNKTNESVTISQNKPTYTQFWNHYDISTLYEDIKDVIIRSSGKNVGEYIFFPVKDDQIFLPNETAYDLSPHKLDIICQNIRTIEKELKWQEKRILIIGDKFHKSFVQSEDQKNIIKNSEDIISLESICRKYKKVSLLDPSDVVLKKIISIAKGRKIVFRATKEGISEYKQRFYERLKLLGYTEKTNVKGILTIGYDIFEDLTEQQTLSHKINDYFPVVLSKNVRDALIRNGYKQSEFLYVPDIVLAELSKITAAQ